MHIDKEDNNTTTANDELPIQMSRSLTYLAKQLESEEDRSKYIKVIELSRIIQMKLEHIQLEKKNGCHIINTDNRKYINEIITEEENIWRVDNFNDYSDRCNISYTSNSSNNTVDTLSNDSSCYAEDLSDDVSIVYNYGSNRNDSLVSSCSYTYRMDSNSSIRLSSLSDNKRSSSDTIQGDIDIDACDKKTMYMESLSECVQSITSDINLFEETKSLAHVLEDSRYSINSLETNSDNDSLENIKPSIIHVAVRRDASLFKIEKLSKDSPAVSSSITAIMTPNGTIASSTSIRPYLIPEESINKEVKSSVYSSAGYHFVSSNLHENQGSAYQKTDELDWDLDLLPAMLHVQKKKPQSLKALIKRNYYLNQYSVIKAEYTTFSPFSGIFYKSTKSGRVKWIMKITIVGLQSTSSEDQKRFGFTFWWSPPQPVETRQHDDAKFALAPDSLVKEALVTWIQSQNELKNTSVLPCLGKADEILRNGRKLYVVYDSDLFPACNN
ncbi:hypothetical protein BDB01DRAFT_847421 [Pilobolus umbonatus]|nr:hypothetical protein BDB01DRAFT_847421 [Pilobolus umbonatus]